MSAEVLCISTTDLTPYEQFMNQKGHVTLLCGISASGKTKYSKQLELQGAVRLCVDEWMWSRYGSDFVRLPSDTQRQLTLEAEADIRSRMQELLRSGHRVVIDSCLCKRFKREAFELAAVEVNADIDKIFLTASRDILLHRLAQRKGSDPNDICVSPEEFGRFTANFQEPDDDEGYLVIHTDDEYN